MAAAEQTEFDWIELTEAAGAHFDAGQLGLAADKWQLASDAAQEFQRNDPRRASSHSNLAVAHRIRGELDLAEQCCRQAIARWQTAAQWVCEMDLPPRARSSLFHLRMERKHRERYHRLALKKFENLLPAGRAGTRNNLAEICQAANRLQEAQQLYTEALGERVDSMGAKEPGAAIIRHNLAGLSAAKADTLSTTHAVRQSANGGIFSAQAVRRHWLIDRPAEFTDEGRLMAALLLAHIIDHAQLIELQRADNRC